MAGAGTVPRPVDRCLRLLDPHAELKRLGLDRHAAAEQHAVGVAGAVADRQDRELGGDVARRGRQPAEPAVGDIEVLDPAGKADLAAQLLELAPQGAHDQRQPVGARDAAGARRRSTACRGSRPGSRATRVTSGPVPREVSLPSLNVPAPPSPKR